MVALDALRFDNRFLAELPADPEPRNTRRQVVGASYSRVQPTPVRQPRMLGWSPEVAALLGLDRAASDPTALAEVLAGNRLVPGMDPYATCYGGHQFGQWAGQLGDGRAISLGEVIAPSGDRFELQLKGAGPTPYSRGADGRAVLRSSLREFVCSEAMHHLGVPTTRALSLVTTGDAVVRDMFYDGRAAPEPGAVVCRVAPSFLRFGHFEIAAARRDTALLDRLVTHTLAAWFPDIQGPRPEACAALLERVAVRTAQMVVHWMRVGFVHGVMNTDNMSVLGLTIDYGPYGWLEGFDPGWTPNTTDAGQRRYAYGQQPRVAFWNLARFAEALLPLVGATAPLEAALEAYATTLDAGQRGMMAAKLGLGARPDGDEALMGDLFELLGATETDMTLYFRGLAAVPTAADAPDEALLAPLAEADYTPLPAKAGRQRLAWLRRYGARVRADGVPDGVRVAGMNAVNPLFVFRNYLAQVAIDAAAEGDATPLYTLLEVLRRPYTEQAGRAAYAAKRPEWARHRAGCSMLSCSS